MYDRVLCDASVCAFRLGCLVSSATRTDGELSQGDAHRRKEDLARAKGVTCSDPIYYLCKKKKRGSVQGFQLAPSVVLMGLASVSVSLLNVPQAPCRANSHAKGWSHHNIHDSDGLRSVE